MKVFVNYSDTHFQLDGVLIPKTFKARRFSDTEVIIQNVFNDSELFERIAYDEIEIDTVVYGTQIETVSELNKIIYNAL